MLNFWKGPLLMPHSAHLTVQIFAIINPVVSELEVLARNKNIRDLHGFYLHTHTHTHTGPREGIMAILVCISDLNMNWKIREEV